MEKKIKCNCNCHDHNWRNDTGEEEHRDCGECFSALLEEAHWFANEEEVDKEIKDE
ncbi:MAG: hypothetical protein RBT05_06945 [Bacteroidales bacterium]|nr:hypothetical protein [Bacteroidales bacterium]